MANESRKLQRNVLRQEQSRLPRPKRKTFTARACCLQPPGHAERIEQLTLFYAACKRAGVQLSPFKGRGRS